MSEFMTVTPGIADGAPGAGSELTPMPKPPATGGAPVPNQESSAFLSRLVQKTEGGSGSITSDSTADAVLSEASGVPVEDFPPLVAPTQIPEGFTPGPPEIAEAPAGGPVVSFVPEDRTPRIDKAVIESPANTESATVPQKPERIDDDPRFKQLVQDASLGYLKTQDAKWFDDRFPDSTVDENGYLTDKDGHKWLPSQNIGGRFTEMETQARTRFSELYPDDAKAYADKQARPPVTDLGEITEAQPEVVSPAGETGEPVDTVDPVVSASETPGAEPAVEVIPAPVDFKAQITENADDLKALWGNLTPDQIQADPELSEIANSFGGDIDRFIASGQEWHTTQGSPENHKDKDIADRLGRIKDSAADVLGKDKAEELIQDARTKKAAETNGNPENLSPEELRISALEAKLEQVLNSNREFAILVDSLRGNTAKLTQLVEQMNKYIQSEDVKEKKSLKKLIAELMAAFFLGAGQDLGSDVGSTIQQGSAPQRG